MTIAQHKVELVQKVLQTQNRNILHTIELILNQAQEEFTFSKEDKIEIDERLQEYERGSAKTYSFEQVKKMVRNNFKRSKK